MPERIDIEPKALDKIPTTPIEYKTHSTIFSDVENPNKPDPKIQWTASDTTNLIAQLIRNLGAMVYTGGITTTGWATIIIVILFVALKFLKII